MIIIIILIFYAMHTRKVELLVLQIMNLIYNDEIEIYFIDIYINFTKVLLIF